MILPNVYRVGYSVGTFVEQVLQRALYDGDAATQAVSENIPSLAEIGHFIAAFPFAYKEWWLNLVSSDPIHVLIETTLLLSIAFMIVNKQKDWRETEKEKLSSREKADLIKDWKENGRSPLAPEIVDEQRPMVVVQSMSGRTMEIERQGYPSSESSVTKSNDKMTVLNFATHDFLGMAASPEVKVAARNALSKYGCGSCGPRGFYGTIDVHLQLEDAISKFTNTEGAIMYSDGASTVSSTVAAFAKRGDLLVVDDGVYEPLVTGVTLSRANVKWFRHNDMVDLRRVLEEIRTTDRAIGRKANDQRRFIVVEGLYKNTGTIVPFDELVALKHEFNFRMILDESFSFGSLGKTGRGVIELYGQRYMYDAEIVTISLENALGSIGGVTVGNEEVVDHQRLSGAGYCFSASSPPFTACAAMSALQQMQDDKELRTRLGRNVAYLHQTIRASFKDVFPEKLVVTSDKRSPIVFIEFSNNIQKLGIEDEEAALATIQETCLEAGVAMVVSGYRPRGGSKPPLGSALRLNVSALLSEQDIDKALWAIRKAVGDVVE